MVKFQIRSEGCRVGRVVSVADSLFRPHPEQRARASRGPKEKKENPAVQLFCPLDRYRAPKAHWFFFPFFGSFLRPCALVFGICFSAFKRTRKNYVNPSIPKDKIFWVMNLTNITVWKSIFSSRSPQKFRLKYQGARDVILRKSHSRPTHSFCLRKPSHFHQHAPP